MFFGECPIRVSEEKVFLCRVHARKLRRGTRAEMLSCIQPLRLVVTHNYVPLAPHIFLATKCTRNVHHVCRGMQIDWTLIALESCCSNRGCTRSSLDPHCCFSIQKKKSSAGLSEASRPHQQVRLPAFYVRLSSSLSCFVRTQKKTFLTKVLVRYNQTTTTTTTASVLQPAARPCMIL
jgi:hypothetical protein